MNINTAQITLSHFKEHPFVDFRVKEPDMYDISSLGLDDCEPDFIKNNQFDLENYCRSIIKKLLTLSYLEIRDFIEYQCKILNNPSCWLIKLDLLCQLNHSIFLTDIPRYIKLQTIIEIVRERIFDPHGFTNTSNFDFKKFKSNIHSLNSYEEKLKALIEQKTIIQQDNILNHSELNEKNIKLIDLEILKLTDLQAFTSPQDLKRPQKTVSKLKFNGNVNVLADIFFQMMNSKAENGLNLLHEDIKTVTDFIVEHFYDKENRELSPNTLKTMLTPSRNDKRPNREKSLKIITD